MYRQRLLPSNFRETATTANTNAIGLCQFKSIESNALAATIQVPKKFRSAEMSGGNESELKKVQLFVVHQNEPAGRSAMGFDSSSNERCAREFSRMIGPSSRRPSRVVSAELIRASMKVLTEVFNVVSISRSYTLIRHLETL